MSDQTEASSANILTQILNVGIEVVSQVASLLTGGRVQIHSELPGGENVGRTSFCEAITSIFSDPEGADALGADGTSRSSAGSSSRTSDIRNGKE